MKVVRMEDGRVGTYGFNLQTGEFEISPTLLNRVTKADNGMQFECRKKSFLPELKNCEKGSPRRNPGAIKKNSNEYVWILHFWVGFLAC